MERGFTSQLHFDTLVDKALRENITATNTEQNGVFAVTSSKGRDPYRVTRDRCNCPAHSFHGACKHRALVIFLLDNGGLTMDDYEASAPTSQDEYDATEAPDVEEPVCGMPTSLHDMITGKAQPKNADDENRLAWAGWS